MLDAYIIEEIKKREEEKRRRDEAARSRLRIELPDRPPLPLPPPERDDSEEDDDDVEPGVIRIDLLASAYGR